MYASALIDLHVFVSGLTHEQLGEVKRLVEDRITSSGIDPSRLGPLPALDRNEISHLKSGEYIIAIKAYRARTGQSLANCKRVCDDWREDNERHPV